MGKLRAAAVGCLVVALALAAAVPAAAYQRPGQTERASVASDGTEANLWSRQPVITPDGRYVAFESAARTLVSDKTSSRWDIFVHDREKGETERVSVASDGTEANRDAIHPAITPDGRYVAFASSASTLVPGDTIHIYNIFVHDRVTGETERVSVSSDGAQANGPSFQPAISADGRVVAFKTQATNLAPEATPHPQLFVHDRSSGVTERITTAPFGEPGNAYSEAASISADGRFVAFHSAASNLVVGDTNGVSDVFVHDRETGMTELASVSSDGLQGNGWSSWPSISADGSLVAFRSSSTNLVPAVSLGRFNIYVRDRAEGRTERVSVSSVAGETDDESNLPSISPDGRYVAFQSRATNLVPDDTNDNVDVFVHDRLARTTERVSVSGEGLQASGASDQPAVSAGGRYAAFRSTASNLVPDDTNGVADIFIRDRGPEAGPVSLTVSPDGAVSGRAAFSPLVVSTAADDVDDGEVALGAELTEASLILRPEEEDLLVRLAVDGLPSARVPAVQEWGSAVPSVAGVPAVLYGLELEVDGSAYEVRAVRVAATASPPQAPYFGLYRCDPECVEVAGLEGGIGIHGDEIVVAVPLDALGMTGPVPVSGLRAYAAVGEAATGAMHVLDDLDLPDAEVPTPKVHIGVAPAAAPADEVAFDTAAALSAGSFTAAVELPGAGLHRVWARACLGDRCGTTSVPLEGG